MKFEIDAEKPEPQSPERNEMSSLWMKAYNSLTRYLGARDHSEKELHFKLSQKYPPDLVDEMIQLAYANHWMADPEELAQRTAERLLERGKGSMYISTYLQNKGLPPVAIDANKALKTAFEAAENRFGDLKELDYDDRPKVLRFLKSRGFSHDVINQVIFGKRQ